MITEERVDEEGIHWKCYNFLGGESMGWYTGFDNVPMGYKIWTMVAIIAIICIEHLDITKLAWLMPKMNKISKWTAIGFVGVIGVACLQRLLIKDVIWYFMPGIVDMILISWSCRKILIGYKT